ncbi:MAG: DUF2975 domain-containing protein [Acidimicrobiia bacterium]|nr:DUF2975 domain-containing protein [Acidimicrobiia bacterium]
MQTRLPRLLRGFTTFAIALLTVVTVAIVVFATVLIGTDESGSAELAVPIQFKIDSDAYSLTSDGWGDGTIIRASGEANFDDPGIGLAIAAGGTILAGLAAAFIALILMRRIFSTMMVGTPFLPENARRIRWLGYMVIGGALVEQIIEIGLGLLVLNSISSTGLDIDYHFDLNLAAVFVGLIILALAEVFRHGTALQADADLTV